MNYASSLLHTLESERTEYPEPLYSMLRCIIVNQINLSAEIKNLEKTCSPCDCMCKPQPSSRSFSPEEDCI